MLRLLLALARAAIALWHQLKMLPREAAMALGAQSNGHPARPRRLWAALALILPVAFVAAMVMPKISIVMSPSIEAWAVREAPGPIRRGDYVKFMLNHPVAGPRPISVTKHALCVPGDLLTTIEKPSATLRDATDALYFCNGRLLGRTLPYAHNGMRLEHLRWNGIIPADLMYVGSSHPQGFDSRYFGLVSIAKLTRMMRLF